MIFYRWHEEHKTMHLKTSSLWLHGLATDKTARLRDLLDLPCVFNSCSFLFSYFSFKPMARLQSCWVWVLWCYDRWCYVYDNEDKIMFDLVVSCLLQCPEHIYSWVDIWIYLNAPKKGSQNHLKTDLNTVMNTFLRTLIETWKQKYSLSRKKPYTWPVNQDLPHAHSPL
jgi:hypothetical protein